MGEELMPAIEVRFEKNINNLTLVREPDTRRQWEYVAVAVLGAMFVVGLLIYGAQLYQYQQYGYQIEDAEKRKLKLETERDRQRLRRDELRDSVRIEEFAKRLGMVPSVPGQYVTVNLESLDTTNPQLAAKK